MDYGDIGIYQRATDSYSVVLLIDPDRAAFAEMDDAGSEIRAISGGLESDIATVDLDLPDLTDARARSIVRFQQREVARARRAIENIAGLHALLCRRRSGRDRQHRQGRREDQTGKPHIRTFH